MNDSTELRQQPEWFASWFESPWYMRLYRHRTDSEARQAIKLVENIGGVVKGSRVLDLACGYGRHALALAEEGYNVVGLDYSKYLIDRARELYPHQNVEYVIGDMRGPYPGSPYDAIVNFFTSFGYFETHADHQATMNAIYKGLKPGGIFMMDFLNAHVVRATLKPESMHMMDGVTIIEERWIEEPFVKKRITINDPCSFEQVYEERVWMYSRQDLATLCNDAGLMVQHTFGDYDGSPYIEATSHRCILICKAG